ncbi:MAG: hypothetical protein WAU78_12815 [Roseiarcus sp.]
MVDPREEQRVWLRAVLVQTGLTPHALAKRARISAPTLTVFLNSDKATHALSARTVASLEAATGMRYGPEPRPSGAFRENEATAYKINGSPVDDIVRAAIGGRNAVDPWLLKSRALEAAGYLPGDVLIVDLNGGPQPGDVVCAQIYNWARSDAQTVFRVWEPPYLTPATFDPALRRVFVVDNDTTMIRGVVIATVRPRQGRGA